MYSEQNVDEEMVVEALARTPTVLLNCGHRVHETCLCQSVNRRPVDPYNNSRELEELWSDHDRWKCFVPGCSVNRRSDGTSVPEVAAREARVRELGIREAPSVTQTFISIADRVQLQDRINLGIPAGQARPLGRAIGDTPQEVALQADIESSILRAAVAPVAPPSAPPTPPPTPPSAPSAPPSANSQQVRELQDQRNTLSRQLRDSQNEKRRAEERLNELEITIETILRDNERQKNDLNVTIEALNTEAAVLRERIASLASLTEENASLKLRLKTLQGEIKQQKETKLELVREQEETMSALVREQEETESILKSVINAKDSQLSAQKEGMESLIYSITKMGTDNETAKAKLQETTSELEKLEASNATLITQNEEWMEENIQFENQIEKLKSDKGVLESQIEKLKNDKRNEIPLRFKKLLIRQNLIQPQSNQYSSWELRRASRLIDMTWSEITTKTESAVGKGLLQVVDRLYADGDGEMQEMEEMDKVDAKGNPIPASDLPYNSIVASLLIECRAAFVWEKLEPGGETLLERFAKLNLSNMIENLIRGGAHLDVYNERTNRNALMVAAENGSGEFVEQLLFYEVGDTSFKSLEPGTGRAVDLGERWWQENKKFATTVPAIEPAWIEKLRAYTLIEEKNKEEMKNALEEEEEEEEILDED
jgi:hypothetical protein